MTEELLPFCECGECGLRVTKKGNRFIWGHNRRGELHTPETCAKMTAWQLDKPRTSPAQIAADKAKVDVPLSPEHCTAITKGNKESNAVKANADRMRGGNDLVTHHYIYDHNDLSLNTVQMTRSDHARLHHLLKKLGYLVPRINLPDEPTLDGHDEVYNQKVYKV